MSIIEDYSGPRDGWAKTHPNTPAAFPQDMQPVDTVHTFGITADSPINTYSAGNPLDDYAIQFQGKRFGCVLSRPPIYLSLSSRMQVLEPTESEVVFTGRVPGKTHSFSDHFGVEATFTVLGRLAAESTVFRGR